VTFHGILIPFRRLGSGVSISSWSDVPYLSARRDARPQPNSKRVTYHDPRTEWWLPSAKTRWAQEQAITVDKELESAVEEILLKCCEDEIDRVVIDCIFVGDYSLRETEELSGIPKTTVARRRDGLKVRLANLLELEPTVQRRLRTLTNRPPHLNGYHSQRP